MDDGGSPRIPRLREWPLGTLCHQANAKGIGTVRYPRIVPKDSAFAKRLKDRTLTKLYNARPTWLDLAHKKLDEAVFAAYGWSPSLSDEEILAKLLALNLERAGEEAGGTVGRPATTKEAGKKGK